MLCIYLFIHLIVKLNNNIFREFNDLFSETKLIEIEDVCNGSSSCFWVQVQPSGLSTTWGNFRCKLILKIFDINISLSRARADSMWWATMVSLHNVQRAHTGWSICQVLHTVFCPLWRHTREGLWFTAMFRIFWGIFNITWRFQRFVKCIKNI